MSKKTVRLDEAELDELRAIAQIRGVAYPKTANSGRLIVLIKKSGWTEETFDLDIAEPAGPKGKPLAKAGAQKVLASSLDPELFERRDLGQADAPLVYGNGKTESELKRLRGEGAIFLDGLSAQEITDIKKRQAELKRLRDLRDNSIVVVMIPKTKEEGVSKFVALGVNGVALVIERGQRSEIRWPFLASLQAQEVHFIKDENDIIIGQEITDSYQHAVLDGPPDTRQAA